MMFSLKLKKRRVCPAWQYAYVRFFGNVKVSGFLGFSFKVCTWLSVWIQYNCVHFITTSVPIYVMLTGHGVLDRQRLLKLVI